MNFKKLQIIILTISTIYGAQYVLANNKNTNAHANTNNSKTQTINTEASADSEDVKKIIDEYKAYIGSTPKA